MISNWYSPNVFLPGQNRVERSINWLSQSLSNLLKNFYDDLVNHDTKINGKAEKPATMHEEETDLVLTHNDIGRVEVQTATTNTKVLLIGSAFVNIRYVGDTTKTPTARFRIFNYTEDATRTVVTTKVLDEGTRWDDGSDSFNKLHVSGQWIDTEITPGKKEEYGLNIVTANINGTPQKAWYSSLTAIPID